MKSAVRRSQPTADVQRHLHAPGNEQDGRQQRRRQQRADRRGRLAVGVGQPVVHRRPADLRRQPGEDEHERDERSPRAAAPPAELSSTCQSRACRPECPAFAWAIASTRIPSRATDRPSVVSTRYFQPASRASRRPLKATSSADVAVVASTSEPHEPEVARDRHDEQRRPEDVERRVVGGARAPRAEPAAPARAQVGGRERARCTVRRPRSPRGTRRWRRRRGTSGRAARRRRRGCSAAAARSRAAAATAGATARFIRSAATRRAREQQRERAGERQRRDHRGEDRDEVSHAGLAAGRCRRCRARRGCAARRPRRR